MHASNSWKLASHRYCPMSVASSIKASLFTTKKINNDKIFRPILKSLLWCLIFTIFFSFSTQYASAWTFEDRSFWYYTGAGTELAALAITFTYPDRLELGEALDVAVILEYVDNQLSNADYVIFSDIQVHLRNVSAREEIGTKNGNNYIDIREYKPLSIKSSNKTDSQVIKKGEQFLANFSLPTDGLDANYYSVDLSFRPLFSLGDGVIIMAWDSMYYLGEGTNLIEEDLPPIDIVQKDDDKSRELAISIIKPHGLIKPVEVLINSTPFNTTDGRLEVNLTADTNYQIEVPAEIDVIDNEVKAVFDKWSDEITSAKRNILLDKNKELFAIYDTQYWLNVTSSLDHSPLYNGWKNSGEQVELSVDPIRTLVGAFNLRGFSAWIGDAYGTDASISFAMDSPKQVVEEWVFDSTILVIAGTVVGVVGSAATIIKERIHIAESLTRFSSWLTKRGKS
jgi:hypothetical protein